MMISDDILSNEETRELISKLKKETDPEKISEIENEIVKGNLRLVRFVSKRINKIGMKLNDINDIKMLGARGLLKAVRTYKLEEGTKFSSWAYPCIYHEIDNDIKYNKDYFECSLNKVIGVDKEGNKLELEDTLSSGYDLEEDIVNKMFHKKITEKLRKMIKESKALNSLQKKIMILRYGFDNPDEGLTLEEIAKILGCTKQNVSCSLRTAQINFREENQKKLIKIKNEEFSDKYKHKSKKDNVQYF